MKSTFFVAAILALVITVTGCEFTDPVSTPEVTQDLSLDKARCTGVVALRNYISIIEIESNPLAENPSGFIIGRVTYGIGPFPEDVVSVSLHLSAELHPLDGTDQLWLFSESSSDQVALSGECPHYLMKTYRTPGQLMTLHVRYEVIDCAVRINSMWAVRDWRTDDVPTDS